MSYSFHLAIFYLGPNAATGNIYPNFQDGLPDDWHFPAGSPSAQAGFAKQVAVSIGGDTFTHIFYVGIDNNVYHTWSGVNGVWPSAAMGGQAKQIVSAANKSGLLEIFYIGTDNNLYHNWQLPNGNWSGQYSLGGTPARQISAMRNQDGRLEIFYVGTDNVLYHNWQVSPAGSWSGEFPL